MIKTDVHAKNKVIKKLLTYYEELKTERSPWIHTWKTLASMFDSQIYRDGDTEPKENDDIINKEILDTVGINAANTLAAGMQGGMTSPARPWFALRLGYENYQYGGSHEADTYLDAVVERMRVIFSISNFYNVMYQAYHQLGISGTACVFEEADLDGFRFNCLPVGSYVFDVDAHGKVNVLIRKIWLSYSQIDDSFGDVLPEEFKLKRKNVKQWRTDKQVVYHVVMPNKKEKIKENSLDPKSKKYISLYFLEKQHNGEFIVLRESGYDNMPFFGVRWEVQSGSIYGKSPALNVLGDNMFVQKVYEDILEGVHKQVNPPVSAPVGMQAYGIDLSAGAINFFANENSGAAVSALNIKPDVNSAMGLLQDKKQAIKEGMYNDLFRMLIGSDRRQITAQEVAAKEQEKLILIGPVLERLQNELFIPLISRTYELMQRYDMLPLAPESLQGQPLKVEFVSTLAQAQKLVSTGSIQNLIMFIGNIAQMKPEALDKLNTDVVIDKYSEYLGVETSLLLSAEKVAEIRQQRAQAQQAQAEQAQMAQMAQTAQAMGNTPVNNTEQPSALDALLGGLGGL